MVYEVKKPQLEEEEEEGNGSQEGFITGGNSGGVMTAGSGKTNQVAEAPTKENTGAGITDINKYLDANRQKIQRLSTDVGNVIQGDIDTARTGISGAGSQFKQDVNTGTVNLDQDVFDRAKNEYTANAIPQPAKPAEQNTFAGEIPGTQPDVKLPTPQYTTPGGDGGASGWVNPAAPEQATEGPTSFLGDEDAVARFREMYGANYAGPNEIAGKEYYNEALTNANKAIRTKDLVNSGAGIQELIARSQENGSGRYSRGVLDLDQALIGADEASMNTLRGIAGGSDVADRLKAMQELAATQVLEGKETTADTRAAMMEEFDVGREGAEIATRADELKAQAREEYDAKLKSLAEEYDIGETLNDATGEAYFDRDKYEQINKFNTATQEDYDRLNALEELTGVQSGYSQYEGQAGQSDSFVNPEDAFLKDKFLTHSAQSIKNRDAYNQQQKDIAAANKKIADEAAAAKKEAEKEAMGTAIGATAGAGIGFAVGGPIGAAVGAAVGGAVGKVVCFHEDTPVLLEDGYHIFIRDLKVGDILMEGGEVYSVSRHLNKAPMYVYEDVFVTGSHCVLEDGEWVRVKDSIKARLTAETVKEVFSFSCINHFFYSGETVFRDYDELDDSQGLTDIQLIKILNGRM